MTLETVLDTEITRRNFFRLAGGIVLAANGLISPSSNVRARITLEEALTDNDNPTGIRQRYIDQLVMEELGQSAYGIVTHFHYDPDFSLAKPGFMRTFDRLVNDPRFFVDIRKQLNDPDYIKEVVDEFIKELILISYTKEETERKIKDFLKTEAGLKKWLEILSKDPEGAFKHRQVRSN